MGKEFATFFFRKRGCCSSPSGHSITARKWIKKIYSKYGKRGSEQSKWKASSASEVNQKVKWANYTLRVQLQWDRNWMTHDPRWIGTSILLSAEGSELSCSPRCGEWILPYCDVTRLKQHSHCNSRHVSIQQTITTTLRLYVSGIAEPWNIFFLRPPWNN